MNSRAPFLGRWVQPALARELVNAVNLTTARVEPILRAHNGFSQLDFLFERDGRCCVVVGSVVDGHALITRERSAIIFSSYAAALVDHAVLAEIAEAVIPWLRSIARARPMCEELVRRYAPSSAFERARALHLPGAASLEDSLLQMAPFVYARRFAAHANVRIRCRPSSLAWATLLDVAAAIDCGPPASEEIAFTRRWFGLPDSSPGASLVAHVSLDDYVGPDRQAILVTVGRDAGARIMTVDVSSPTPWDVVNVFDPSDAPSVARFAVRAAELTLRAPFAALPAGVVPSGSGTIALAISGEARTFGGEELLDIRALESRLTRAGFRVAVSADPGDCARLDIDLVHIVGSVDDAHVEQWAVAAQRAGVPYIIDIAPLAVEESHYIEKMFGALGRTMTDDATTNHYLEHFAQRRLTGSLAGERTAEAVAAAKAGFTRAASGAVSVIVACDSPMLADVLPPRAFAHRQFRGTLQSAAVDASPIGHLAPHGRFALVHGTFGWPSHALFAALILERAGIPCVIAGNVYDVDYLASVRMAAPGAVVLADPDRGVVEALYRRAAWWVDAAPHPRSASGLLRAVACGALPVVTNCSPLRVLLGDVTPSFSPIDVESATAVLRAAWRSESSASVVSALQDVLAPLIDPEQSFRRILAAYAPAAPEAVRA